MNDFCKKICTSAIAIPLLMSICCFAIGAGIGVSWTKSKVTPVIIVEPDIRGFKPMGNSSIGNRWSKAQVKPVLLVKPGTGGFVPYEGTIIGNQWAKKDVTPVMLVEPETSKFIPLRAIISAGKLIGGGASRTFSTTPSVIESKVDGEFEGWDGETIVKLTNGQIWQQIEYHYHYRYAYMPEVLIFKSGGVYKMKVEGIKKAVRVERLK